MFLRVRSTRNSEPTSVGVHSLTPRDPSGFWQGISALLGDLWGTDTPWHWHIDLPYGVVETASMDVNMPYMECLGIVPVVPVSWGIGLAVSASSKQAELCEQLFG